MKILVVDDARDMRMVIQHLLKKLGHDVDTAIDGEDAWLKRIKLDYHIVVSDWNMPNLDGLELCKRVREASFDRYIYFILLTGKTGKKNLISGIQAGADDFATKPADIEELEVRLRSAHRILNLENTLAQKNKILEETSMSLQVDLINAENTQLSLLPKPLDNDYIKTSWLYKPAIYVGGDTFNYFMPSKEILVYFSIDISGHGISSAMLSMSLQSSLAFKRGLYSNPIRTEYIADMPSIFAHNLNQMILESSTNHYLTMNFGIIDFSNKELHYTQAGHPHPMWYDKSLNTLEEQKIDGFPIGLVDDAEYETQHRNFSSGDKFIIYSDGISENESAQGGGFLDGENLLNHFESIKQLSTEDMIGSISNNWLTKDQIKSLPDDLSVLLFEFK